VPGLTPRQAAVLAALVAGLVARGRAPTAREVCAVLGLRSPGTVAAHCAELRRKGYLGPGGAVLAGPDGLPFDLRAAVLAGASTRDLAAHLAGRPDAGPLADAVRSHLTT
jgi:SOS-response transcriptional repressor LexA